MDAFSCIFVVRLFPHCFAKCTDHCRVVDMVHTTIVIAVGVGDRSSVPGSA
jgi:hypothetical protein